MPAKMDNQCSDSENTKALHTATSAGDDLRKISQKSAQSIAQERTNLGGYEGGGGQNPGASIKKGVANNA